MADRYIYSQEFDGVLDHDVYTDTLLGTKYGGIHDGDTGVLLNSQAAEIANLRSRIDNLVDACATAVSHIRYLKKDSVLLCSDGYVLDHLINAMNGVEVDK